MLTINKPTQRFQAISPLVPLTVLLCLALPAQAQHAPDAGQTLQQLQPPLQVPKPTHGIDMQLPKAVPTLPGGMQISLKSVRFSGNTQFSAEDLQAALGKVEGRSFDMAGLRGLVDTISQHYRSNGFPFARAFLPPQQLTDGDLRIEILEGHYGKIQALSDDPALAADADAFLVVLKPDKVIKSAPLERTTLLLDDLPGIKSSPLIRPGQELGSGDLDVQVERTNRFTGDVGLDNYGNRYTGQTRAHLNFNANSPFVLGDQISLRSLVTKEGMWFGNLSYSLPLGVSGMRGMVSYSRSYYELGKEFSDLRSNGTADMGSIGLSYPIMRSQHANLAVSGTYQYKWLNDRQDAADTHSDKSSDSLPLTLSFDLRDGLGGGGITYGAVSWTSGNLHLDSTLDVTDQQSARTAGSFDKANLDLARIQNISNPLSVYGRLAAQWSSKNLDSSEDFGLGGPTGVRAYPVGEGYGDRGWLGQLELRYTLGAYAPYVFHDTGEVTINARPWSAGENKRRIAGSGIGLRYQHENWNLDATIAWRNLGGRAESDTVQRTPMGWLTANYRF